MFAKNFRKLTSKKYFELCFENFPRKIFEILKFSFFKLTFRRKKFRKFFDLEKIFEIGNFSNIFSSESQFEKWKFQNFDFFREKCAKKSSDFFSKKFSPR